MALEICRLCLSKDNLMPIFVDLEQCNSYSVILELTTGLKIEPNDDLPQSICKNCTEAVNSALNLRNKSSAAEKEILKNIKNLNKNTNHFENMNFLNDSLNDKMNDSNDLINDIDNDDLHNDRLRNIEIEVQCDRLTENDEVKLPPLDELKKMSRREKRQVYLNLVDGDFVEKGPIKCKVCKTTVSKWACFISHAKLHLGFNYVCEFCGKSFTLAAQFKRHCRSYHGMKRELQCKHCTYLALDNVQLKLHVRRMHTGERPYICDHCSAAYHSRPCLVQHIESHRTVATVKCEQCPRVFKSRRHLSRHRYSAHAHARRALCVYCDKAVAKKYLAKHLAKYHAADDTSIQ